mgnify:CR=1 FL=1
MLGLDAMDDNGGKSCDPSDFHQRNRKFLVINASTPNVKITDIAPPITREKVLGEDIIFEALNCMSVPHSLDSKSIVRSYNQLYVQVRWDPNLTILNT